MICHVAVLSRIRRLSTGSKEYVTNCIDLFLTYLNISYFCTYPNILYKYFLRPQPNSQQMTQHSWAHEIYVKLLVDSVDFSSSFFLK
jgi:hypothetical protein